MKRHEDFITQKNVHNLNKVGIPVGENWDGAHVVIFYTEQDSTMQLEKQLCANRQHYYHDSLFLVRITVPSRHTHASAKLVMASFQTLHCELTARLDDRTVG